MFGATGSSVSFMKIKSVKNREMTREQPDIGGGKRGTIKMENGCRTETPITDEEQLVTRADW